MSNTDSATSKIPPHSVDAEQRILGALMLDSSAWDVVSDQLTINDFYQLEHRIIFNAITTLHLQERAVDVITVSTILENDADFKKAGGLSYVAELAKNALSASNVKAYAEIIRERSLLRQLIQVGQEIADLGFNPNGVLVDTLVDAAESKVFAISDQHTHAKSSGPRIVSDILGKTVQRIEDLVRSGSSITGIPTGFIDFDKLTAGLQPSDLVIIAGRPSMGKTTLALNIAEYVSLKTDKAVLMFSMEMPAEQVVMRILSSLGRIELQKLRTGDLKDEDWSRIGSSVSLMGERKLFIDDTGALSPNEVRARARRLAREQKSLGLIVVDYLQLMHIPQNQENRTIEISEISRSLKNLARELNVPVIALSQLNRSLEQRSDRRPIMSDLRESGAIEQDADLITFIYRDEVYNKDSMHKGTAEIIIAKQRNGPIGTTRLTFLGQYAKFENYTQTVIVPIAAQHSGSLVE